MKIRVRITLPVFLLADDDRSADPILNRSGFNGAVAASCFCASVDTVIFSKL